MTAYYSQFLQKRWRLVEINWLSLRECRKPIDTYCVESRQCSREVWKDLYQREDKISSKLMIACMWEDVRVNILHNESINCSHPYSVYSAARASCSLLELLDRVKIEQYL